MLAISREDRVYLEKKEYRIKLIIAIMNTFNLNIIHHFVRGGIYEYRLQHEDDAGTKIDNDTKYAAIYKVIADVSSRFERIY